MVTGSSRWNKLSSRWLLQLWVAAQLCTGAHAQETLELEVRAGDTLIGISQRLLDSPQRWPELKTLNRITKDRRLRPGSLLRIPLDWLRWSELPAEVVYVHGVVTGNNGPLAPGMRLKAGDSLDTGAQGSLTLRLPDGAVVVFAPMTRAALGVLRQAEGTAIRATSIELRGGALDTTATPLQQPASRFEVRTPRVVTAVRGTRFRVALEGDVSRHEVVSGLVAVTGATPQETRVAPGQGLRANAGLLGAVVPLLGAPDLSGVPPLVERTAQPLQVAPMPAAAGWRWQVAADGGFTQLLQDAKTRVPVWVLTGLADGDYHLRVRAFDPQELEGKEAQLAFALRARPEPPLQIAPPPGASVTSGAALVWGELAGATTYRLQVARDAKFTELLYDAPVAASRLPIDAAWSPGQYHWRVATQRPDGSRGPFGDPGSFTLLAPSAVAPPQVGDGGLRLSWSGPAGFGHRVQLSRDAEFSATEFDQVVPGASLELPSPEPGVHYVRMQLVLPDGGSGPWSTAQRFEVPKNHPWLLLLLLLLPLL